MHSNFDIWHFVGGIALSLPTIFFLASSLSAAVWLQPPKSHKRPGWTRDIPFSRPNRFLVALFLGACAADSFAAAFQHDILHMVLPIHLALVVLIAVVFIRDMRHAKSSHKSDA